MEPLDEKSLWQAHPRLPLALIFVLGLALRLVWVVSVMEDEKFIMEGDGRDYYQLSLNLVHGQGFALWMPGANLEGGQPLQQTARRPPLFPLFASTVLKKFMNLTEPDYASVLFVQALIDSLTCLLAFYLARELTGSREASFIAALLYAVNFFVFQFSGKFLSETLFIFFQTAALLVTVRAVREKDPSSSLLFLAGALWGLAALTWPVVLFFPIAVVIWMAVRARVKTVRETATLLLFPFAFILILAPWAIRNRLVLGRAVPVSTVGGQTFYNSNHATSNGQWVPLPIPDEAKGLNEAELDSWYYREGLKFAATHPFLTLKNAAIKALRLYYVFYPAYDLFFGVTFMLAVPGVWFHFQKEDRNWLPAMLIIYTTLLCIIFWGAPRFRAPLLPCFVVFAAGYAGSHLKELDTVNRRRHLITIIGIVLANLLVAIFAEEMRAIVKAIF